jgi:serine protease Do
MPNESQSLRLPGFRRVLRARRAAAAAAAVVLCGVAFSQAPLPNFDRRTPVVLAVQNVGPAVVSIATQSKNERRFHPFQGLFQRNEDEAQDGGVKRSVGSGVVVHPDGFVVTNDHVVSGADRIFVVFADQGDKHVEAELLNSDGDNDLAVLKIKGDGPFPYARFGDSDGLLVGETTIALGCPFGIGATVTTGVLSAKNRPVMFRGKEVFRDFLQTSALIHPGNSGGPLLDVNGYVIGVNVAIDVRGAGIGYAIPSARVREVVTHLTDPTIVRRAVFGMEFENDASLKVSSVERDGPAERAGVRPGDVVVAVGDAPVAARMEFNFATLARLDGGAVPLRLRRGNATSTVEVAAATSPLSVLTKRSFAKLGFSVSDVTPRLAKEFRLESTSGAVVTSVEEGGAASRIDIRQGDVLYQAGVYRVKNADALDEILRHYARRAEAVEVLILRDGRAFRGGLPLR